METKTKYVALDGKEFNDEETCEKYEAVLITLDAIFNELPAIPSDRISFANGSGFIQHDKDTFDSVVRRFTSAAYRYHKGLEARYVYNTYGFWRTLEDTNSPFYSFGQRLLNTDEDTYREYGQPYYKLNPTEIRGGQVN
ncbi:MAG: hypothetical protein ACR2PH_05940 [Desulfobulbia bacterium]